MTYKKVNDIIYYVEEIGDVENLIQALTDQLNQYNVEITKVQAKIDWLNNNK